MIRVQPVWSQVHLVGACWLWCLEAGPWLVLPQGMCLTVHAGPLELASLVVTDLLVIEGFGLPVERVNVVVRVLLKRLVYAPIMLGQKTQEFSADTVDTFAGAESHFTGPKVV